MDPCELLFLRVLSLTLRNPKSTAVPANWTWMISLNPTSTAPQQDTRKCEPCAHTLGYNDDLLIWWPTKALSYSDKFFCLWQLLCRHQELWSHWLWDLRHHHDVYVKHSLQSRVIIKWYLIKHTHGFGAVISCVPTDIQVCFDWTGKQAWE